MGVASEKEMNIMPVQAISRYLEIFLSKSLYR